MRKLEFLLVLAPLAFGGCVAMTDHTPPKQTTVVVPQATTTTVVCANGTAPPCY